MHCSHAIIMKLLNTQLLLLLLFAQQISVNAGNGGQSTGYNDGMYPCWQSWITDTPGLNQAAEATHTTS